MRYFPLFAALYVKFADSLPDDYLSPGTEQISGALGVQPTTDAGAAKIDSFGTGDSLALLQTTPGDPDLQLDGIKAVEGCKPQSDPGANKKRQAYIPNLCYPSQNQGVPPPSSIETTPPIIPEILNPEFPDIFAKPAKPPQRAPPGPIPYHPPIIKNENNPLIESGGDTRRCSSQVLTLCCWGPKHITDIYYCVKCTLSSTFASRTHLFYLNVIPNARKSHRDLHLSSSRLTYSSYVHLSLLGRGV